MSLWPGNLHSMVMHMDLVIRIVFGGLFVATLIAGYFLFKNFDKLFGPDPNSPSDNEGARGLNKVQFIAIWLHALALTGAFAFLLG
jgi:hypothetical protein